VKLSSSLLFSPIRVLRLRWIEQSPVGTAANALLCFSLLHKTCDGRKEGRKEGTSKGEGLSVSPSVYFAVSSAVQ
jgi:hypothetical protein